MYRGKGFLTTPKPYAFDGYPYLATFLVPHLYHIILLPAGLSAGELREIARRQFEANRLETYLVIGSQECIRFQADGSPSKTDSPPQSDGWETDRLLPSKEFQMTEELKQRRVRLLELIARESKKRYWTLAGDLTKGGRPATREEILRLSGAQDYEIPKGLVYCDRCGAWRGECLDPNPVFQGKIMKVHCRCENDNRCARCGRPLYEYKLNANYYNPEDGQIWHVPAFVAFNHRCPDLK
jgi:hypothetical protein